MIETDPYYSLDLLSNSRLGIVKSIISGAPIMKAKKETLDFGKQLHEAVLEPEKYEKNLLLFPDDYEKNKYKIKTMADAARSNAILAGMLANAGKLVEHNIFFKEALYEIECKAKIDIWTGFNGENKGGTIGDLKSTAEQTREGFEIACLQYGYFRQAAFYLDATDSTQFILFGICKKFPHKTFTIKVSHDDPRVCAGRSEYESLINSYIELKKQNKI